MSKSKTGKDKDVKERRARGWERGKERRHTRDTENRARAGRNVLLRAEGRPTPWEVSRSARTSRRAAQRVNGDHATHDRL